MSEICDITTIQIYYKKSGYYKGWAFTRFDKKTSLLWECIFRIG